MDLNFVPWGTALFLLFFICWISSYASPDKSSTSEIPLTEEDSQFPSEIYQIPRYKQVYNIFEDPYYTDKYYPTSQYYLRPYVTGEKARYHSIYQNPPSFWPEYGGRYDWLATASYFGDWSQPTIKKEVPNPKCK